MFISCLLIDVGDNPDRPRPGRLWLRNVYRVHQRLCMAFPSDDRKTADAHFLRPYDPADFARANVHVERSRDAGFLFRIDPQPGGRVVIVVASAMRPDWAYAFHNANHLLAAQPSEPRLIQIDAQQGRRFRFQLLANPTKKTDTLAKADRLAKAEKRHGRRVPVANEQLEEWLSNRATRCGFRVESIEHLRPGFVYVNKGPERGEGQRLRSVRYAGVLQVTDPALFSGTLVRGIGPAKAFGFGLLSVAPVR